MENFRNEQGTILTVGMTLISIGGTIVASSATGPSWEGMLSGAVLLVLGAGLVFWREKRKDNK